MSYLKVFGAVSILACAFTSYGQSENVSVLQTNMNQDFGPNGPNSQDASSLAQEINYLNPDVWNMQELGGNNSGYTAAGGLASLESFISKNVTIFGANPVAGVNYYAYVSPFTDGYIGNAIVSRFPITFSTSYSDGLRGLTQATIALPNGASLNDFTIHLKASSGVSNAEERQSEANTDAANVSAWMKAHPGTATILTGDFNEDQKPGDNGNYTSGSTLPNGQVYHPITTILGAGLTDSDPSSVNGYDTTIESNSTHPTTRFDYSMYSNNGSMSYQSGLVFNTLDYTADQLAAMNAAAGTNLTANTSPTASDHLPVFVTYSVAPVPEPASLLALAGLAALAARRRRAG